MDSSIKRKIISTLKEADDNGLTDILVVSSVSREARVSLAEGKISDASIKESSLLPILPWKLMLTFEDGTAFELSQSVADERIRTIALSLGQAIQLDKDSSCEFLSGF
jgi:hypothetical protein